MATQQVVNVGTQENDATGDLLRDAFTKINNNFAVFFTGNFPTAQMTVGPPVSGVTLTVNGFPGSNVANFVGGTGNFGAISIRDGQAGTTLWTISAGVSAAGDFNIVNSTAGTTPIKVSAAGAITLTGAVNAATSLAVAGAPVLTSAVTSIAGTANQIAASAATGAVTLSMPVNVVIPTASSGTALAVTTSSTNPGITVTGAGTVPLQLQELTALPTSVLGGYVGIGTGAIVGGSGVNGDLVLIPRTSNACSVNIATGNGAAVVRVQVNSAGNVLMSGSLGIFGNVAPSQSTGWGTPVGGAVINNYNITDAGGANSNTNKVVAQIIAVLKAFGLLAT